MDFNYSPGICFQPEIVHATSQRLQDISDQHNIQALRNELKTTVYIFSKLVALIQDKHIPFPGWMKHSEVLFIKFALHTASVNQLAGPVPFALRPDGMAAHAYDRASLYVVARAQIEAFLTLHYLILSPETDEQGRFFHLVYELSGLCNRQRMPAISESDREQKNKDALRIDVLRKAITNHPCFATLDTSMRGKINGQKPPARLVNSWEELIKQSSLNDQIFIPRWKHYSGYAHSEFISSLQIPLSIKDPEYNLSDVSQTIVVALMTIGITIFELLNLVPVLQKDYNDICSEEEKISIHFYATPALKPNIQINRQISLP